MCFCECVSECVSVNVFRWTCLQYNLNCIRKFWSCCYLSFHCFFIKLKTRCSIISCKTRNHPKASPATHKPEKPSTNCRRISQTIHKPSTNHPQTNQITHKPTKNPPIMSRKLVFYVTKNFSNNVNYVPNFQPFYSISSTFSRKDQSQVTIEEKLREII